MVSSFVSPALLFLCCGAAAAAPSSVHQAPTAGDAGGPSFAAVSSEGRRATSQTAAGTAGSEQPAALSELPDRDSLLLALAALAAAGFVASRGRD